MYASFIMYLLNYEGRTVLFHFHTHSAHIGITIGITVDSLSSVYDLLSNSAKDMILYAY